MAGAVLLRCGSVNIRQQTGFKVSKQRQIEDFILRNCLDICSFQEIDCNDETFSNCNYISSSFNLITNNSPNKYGTACLIKSYLNIENIHFDNAGRVIVFDVADITIVSVYLPSKHGT
jgi:exonuclease III